jgi:hypothetical protein
MNSRAWLFTVAISILFNAATANDPKPSSIRLNAAAFDFARELIEQGNFVADQKGDWKGTHPTRAEENDFLRDHGFDEYAKWHLGVDERHAKSSKARYKFPFGDFRNVHRSGLLAVKARAHEFGYQEIENAAAKLLELVESARPAAQKRVD